MTDPALSLLGQALGITNFLETALKRRTVCIAGTLKMKTGTFDHKDLVTILKIMTLLLLT